MKKSIIITAIVSFCILSFRAQTISTFAGNGQPGFSGDGGLATNANLYGAMAIAIDQSGNILIADRVNQRIRIVTPSGVISTFAGGGNNSGDGILAINSQLGWVIDVETDSAGNVFFIEENKIRKINSAGILSTVAGIGSAGFSGDGGPAINAQLNSPSSIHLDGAGNILIADTYNQRIRKISANGIITTIAGNGANGEAGDGGQALAAEFSYPRSVINDASGNLYIGVGTKIRKVNTAGIIDTFAGGVSLTTENVPAASASIGAVHGLAFDVNGNLFLCDYGYMKIRKINPSGMISSFAGNGTMGYSGDGGAALNAQLNTPNEIKFDMAGSLYIAENFNSVVRKITAAPQKNTEISIDFSVSIFPNPASNQITVLCSDNTKMSYALLNALGQNVLSGSINSQANINVSAISQGIYTLKIGGRTGYSSHKVVVGN